MVYTTTCNLYFCNSCSSLSLCPRWQNKINLFVIPVLRNFEGYGCVSDICLFIFFPTICQLRNLYLMAYGIIQRCFVKIVMYMFFMCHCHSLLKFVFICSLGRHACTKHLIICSLGWHACTKHLIICSLGWHVCTKHLIICSLGQHACTKHLIICSLGRHACTKHLIICSLGRHACTKRLIDKIV